GGGAGIEEGEVVVGRRSGAPVDAVGLEADEARDRQTALGTTAGLAGGMGGRGQTRHCDRRERRRDPMPSRLRTALRTHPSLAPNKVMIAAREPPADASRRCLSSHVHLLQRFSVTEGL